MRLPRFHTAQPLAVDARIVLEPGPSHHLLKVLRVHPGEALILFNGDGREYRATLESGDGKQARVTVTEADSPQRESRLRITLGQGVSRGERMDHVMQKAVELGVCGIAPLWTRRSQVHLSGARLEKRLAHWQGVLLAACEQSGRVRVPVLEDARTLARWLEKPAEGCRLLLDPAARTVLADIEPQDTVQLLIGPEGGFEGGEIEQATAAGFQPVRLGPRVLRTETAALATLAALQTLWGDFSDRP